MPRTIRPKLVPTRDIQDTVDARHRSAQGIRIRDVSSADIDANRLEVARALRIAGDRHDIVTGVDQLPRDATPDEAGGARHAVLRHPRPRAGNEAAWAR